MPPFYYHPHRLPFSVASCLLHARLNGSCKLGAHNPGGLAHLEGEVLNTTFSRLLLSIYPNVTLLILLPAILPHFTVLLTSKVPYVLCTIILPIFHFHLPSTSTGRTSLHQHNHQCHHISHHNQTTGLSAYSHKNNTPPSMDFRD